MTDSISKERRSANMSRIKSRDTKPEKTVRSALHRLGFRFRLYRPNLPGKPDIVLPKYKVVIFVHGCFWHQHAGCKRATQPKSNRKYWTPKLKRNIERFYEIKREYRQMGWKVLVIWECEAKKAAKLIMKLNLIK
jgi:DNA mismatch endonuclease (patch repair protein)